MNWLPDRAVPPCFDAATSWLLAAAGLSESACRARIKGWCDAHGPEVVMTVLMDTARRAPLDPIPEIVSLLSGSGGRLQ